MWGETIESEEDVWDVFTRYLTGEPNKNGVKVNNEQHVIHIRSHIISKNLSKIHLTTNSGLTFTSVFR
jgi:hypothetical protein